MSRLLALLLSFCAVSQLRGSARLLATLPSGASPTATQLDAAGNIYVVGTLVPANKNFISAFVAKLSSDGSKVLYFTVLAGSDNDTAAALAVGPDGSAYVVGNTLSPDFPVTPGALQEKHGGVPGRQREGWVPEGEGVEERSLQGWERHR